MADLLNLKIDFTKKLSPLFAQAGLKSVYATQKALDEVGNRTKTVVTRAVAKQSGIKYGRAKSVIASMTAVGKGGGQYKMIARDVTLSLKEFAPRETAKGVSAAPWGTRRVFPHTFVGPGGHIFVRKGAKRLPVKQLWGPSIPKEFIKGESEAAFYKTTEELLGPAIEKYLLRILG